MQPQPSFQDYQKKQLYFFIAVIVGTVAILVAFTSWQFREREASEKKASAELLILREQKFRNNDRNLYPGCPTHRALEILGYPDYKTYATFADNWHYKIPDGEYVVYVMDSQVIKTKFVKSLPQTQQPDKTHPQAESH